MKRIREISIGTVISFLLMTGCMQTTVKPAPQALAKQAEKKTAASPAAVQSEPKKADSMGNAGGKSDVKSAAEIQLAKHRKSSTNREAIERSKQFRAEYEKVGDKLGFLLAHVDSPYDEILVEIAALLRQYDDPKSIAVLKTLEHIGTQDGSPRSIAQTAGESLQWMAAAPDLEKLKPGMPPRELEALILKYRLNDVARAYIFSSMKKEYEQYPATYVPLFVEYYSHEGLTIEIAKKYSAIADRGLDNCLKSTNIDIVRECFGLIAGLKKESYLDKVYEIAFENKGNLDYSSKQISWLKDDALSAYWFVGEMALNQLEKVLYTGTTQERRLAVNYLGNIKTVSSLTILKKFLRHYTSETVVDKGLLDRTAAVVLEMERTAK